MVGEFGGEGFSRKENNGGIFFCSGKVGSHIIFCFSSPKGGEMVLETSGPALFSLPSGGVLGFDVLSVQE